MPERRRSTDVGCVCAPVASSRSRPRPSTASAPTPSNDGRRAPDLRRQGPPGGPPADRPHRVRRALAAWAADGAAGRGTAGGDVLAGPADACWCPGRAHVLDVVTGGRDTVGLRVPAHPLTLRPARPLRRRRRRAVGQPLRAGLPDDGRARPARPRPVVDVILDGGPCPIGVESTIVDCTRRPAQVLRPGGIPDEEIAGCSTARSTTPSGPSRAPGMLAVALRAALPVVLARRAADGGGARASIAGRVDVLDGTADLAAYAQLALRRRCATPTTAASTSSSPSCPRPPASATPSATASRRPPPARARPEASTTVVSAADRVRCGPRVQYRAGLRIPRPVQRRLAPGQAETSHGGRGG